VVVRFPAGPRVRLKTVDPPKGNGLGQKKRKEAQLMLMQQAAAEVLVALSAGKTARAV